LCPSGYSASTLLVDVRSLRFRAGGFKRSNVAVGRKASRLGIESGGWAERRAETSH
jgi:hypothetical protein